MIVDLRNFFLTKLDIFYLKIIREIDDWLTGKHGTSKIFKMSL